ncbi:HEAT repeat domain-containing protein [Neolewinella antarctica]|uniref:HEAT repeat domain-containing protein n=1 Tax=Neolewinella antarctica TaxID=442734 RepID=A0ABX0XEF1_9BACT|nr:HEAT repeat domain-containing protein [Neolewinella antarctica]NJC27597.1 hypothetical protein [Neolewinella antarctica]
MNTVTETELIDYLSGELNTVRRTEITDLLANNTTLAAELAELRAMRTSLAGLEDLEPSAMTDQRFAAVLAATVAETAEQAATTTENGSIVRRMREVSSAKNTSGRMRSLSWKIAAVAAAIALIFTAGRYYEGGSALDADRELAATRTLMLDLMNDNRTSARIRATTVTLNMPTADPVTTQNLGYLLRNDNNANVRLAALDALRRFVDDPGVRDELLAAIAESPPDVVRFELIETLVRARDSRVLPYLQELIDTDSTPRPMRDVARMGRLKLI